jgi:ElaB/YqjD/DUF883 family membrane-anchored ribosome-binding protein
VDQTTGSVDDRFVRGGTNTTTASNDPAELEAQIAQTRREMGETIDEIQQRLAPDRLRQEAQETVRQATIGKVEDMKDKATHTASNWRDDMMRTVKENPVPAAMIGLGLGWLLMERSNDERRQYYGRSRAYASGYMGSDYRQYDQGSTREGMRQRTEEVRDRARETVSEVEDRVQQTTSQLEHRAQETAEQVRERAEQMQHQAEERYNEMRHRVRQETREVKSDVQRVMHESPLAAGAVALALGLGVGLLMPSTRQEDELLGPYRDQFVDRAQDKAEETMDQVRSVASEAQSAAKDAMQDVKQETKKAAEEVKQQTKQEAKRQNITGMDGS